MLFKHFELWGGRNLLPALRFICRRRNILASAYKTYQFSSLKLIFNNEFLFFLQKARSFRCCGAKMSKHYIYVVNSTVKYCKYGFTPWIHQMRLIVGKRAVKRAICLPLDGNPGGSSVVFWNGSSVVLEDPDEAGMSWNSHHHTCRLYHQQKRRRDGTKLLLFCCYATMFDHNN